MAGNVRLLMFVGLAAALLSQSQAHAQVAPTPDQSFLTLMASSDRGTVTLTGRNLASFTGATIVPDPICHIIAAHSREGDLVTRSVEATIIHHADFMSFLPFKNLAK